MRQLPHPHARTVGRSGGFLPATVPVAASLLAIAMIAPPSAAAAREPSVSVDLSVLDSLPPAPKGESRITLHPPKPPERKPEAHAAKRAPAKPAAKTAAAPNPRTEAFSEAARLPAPTEAQPPSPATAAPAAADNAAAPSNAAPAAPAPAQKLAVNAPPARPAAAPATPVAAPAAIPQGGLIRFTPGQTEISAEAKSVLDAAAARLAGDGTLRLQLLSYASGTQDDPIEARRLSLVRAVAVRAYLIEKGVPSVRIDVRALGNRSDGGKPADRVELAFLDH